jgi:hypothetical protein
VNTKRPHRYTYATLRAQAEKSFGRSPEGQALRRIMAVAESEHADYAAQQLAVLQALREELAIVDEGDFPGAAALDEFRAEMRPELTIREGAPIPWLEHNRPAWAARHCDQDRHNPDDELSDIASMSWRSEPLSVPLSSYYGRWDDDTFQSARIMLDVRQNVTQSEPRIAFERHGYKLVKGESEIVDGEDHYTITVDEAVRLARALLLLADVARGTTDTIADSQATSDLKEAM